ncbi:hypothetical protein GCM10029963_16320 [Micromonospora andamanensis]
MATMTMAKALNAALADAMLDDERVLVFGEDVGQLGGVFRITDGLQARFGDKRCFDTPSPRPASSASLSDWPCPGYARWSRCSSTRSRTRRSSRSPPTWRKCATAPGAR